ncbi:MAG: phage portal protein [Planctomycetota bacterium]
MSKLASAHPVSPEQQAAYAKAWGFASEKSSMPVDQFFDLVKGRSASDVSNPYSKVGVVYACVKAKAEAMAMMPMRISDREDQVIESGPLALLAQRPNPKLTARNYRRAMSAYLDLFGVAYHVNLLSTSRTEVLEYTVRSPIEMTEIKDRGTGEIIAYEHRPVGAAGVHDIIPAEQVHRIVDADFGSGDLGRPLAARRAVGLAVRQYFKADSANDNSLEFGASGGMGLRSERNLTEPQKKELLAQLRERHSGHNNRHKWMLLEGGLTIERLFNSFQEMEFSALKQMTREDICVGFGLNTLVLGYQASGGLGSGQTLDAGHLVVWTNTHLPRAERFAEEWCEAILTPVDGPASAQQMMAERRAMSVAEKRVRMRREASSRARAFDLDYYAWFDPSGVPVLQQAALDLAKQAGEWVEKGVPLNQVLRAFDIPFEEVPWGDTWWRNAGLIDVQDDTPVIDDPPGPPGSDEPEDIGPAVDPDDDGDDDEGTRARAIVEREVTEQQLASIWQAWRLSWVGLDKAARSKVSRHFSELQREVMSKLDRLLGGDKAVRALSDVERRDLIAEILFNIVEANGSLVAKVGPIMREATRLGGEQAMTEHAQATGSEADPFRIDDPDVVSSLRRRELQLTDVNRTLRRQVRDTLEAGLTGGETTAQITERIRKTFSAANGRAATIARTEIGRSVEEARHIGRKQAGTPLKSWLWSRRETGREHHMQAEAQTLVAPLPNSQKFVLPQTGNTCDHPRATGEPEDDINCGCTTLARFPGDGIKAVVGRYLSRGFLTHKQLTERTTP